VLCHGPALHKTAQYGKRSRRDEPLPHNPVTRRRDLWLLGKHRLLCGDAREADDFTRLMNGALASAVFCDPPYNLRVSAIGGRGRVRRPEFAFASGDMLPSQFRTFLSQTLANGVRVSAEAFKNSETEIELTARGFRLATVGGTLTGRGGDTIVIDDPLKPDDAMSETKRSAANQWFTNTLLSHLDDKRTGAIVVVMQRVHIDDLTGFLLDQSDEWDVFSLSAIADCDEAIPLSAHRTYRRKSGEALSPEREPLDVLDAMKLQIGSDAFSAQYQQSPAPPGGAMVKRDWIVCYKELPPVPDRLMTLQSWDTASKGGPENDWSVCTTWIVARHKRWFLVDVWRRRVNYPTLETAVQTLAIQWNAKRVLVEDAGAGTSLVQELKGRVSGIIAVRTEGDKASRMAVASAKFEAGQVLLPERAPWLADLEAELFVFPGSRHDDQCDSISQALLDKNISFMTWLTPEDWDRLLAKSRTPMRRPVLL
jgi:predicted phage terminase large subunit-like protein